MIPKTESPRQVGKPRKDNKEFILKWKFAFHYDCVGERGRTEVRLQTTNYYSCAPAPTEISERSLDIGFTGHRFIMFLSDNVYPSD